MDAACMAFGGLVSTSNVVAKNEVTVANSDPVIWTMSFLDEHEAEEDGTSNGDGASVSRSGGGVPLEGPEDAEVPTVVPTSVPPGKKNGGAAADGR